MFNSEWVPNDANEEVFDETVADTEREVTKGLFEGIEAATDWCCC